MVYYWFDVIAVSSGSDECILLKEGTYDILGLVDGVTQKYTLGIALGAFGKIVINLVGGYADGIFLKQCASCI